MANEVRRKTSVSGTSLSAKWQLDAALLSRPVDLTTLVSMSRFATKMFKCVLGDDRIVRLTFFPGTTSVNPVQISTYFFLLISLMLNINSSEFNQNNT